MLDRIRVDGLADLPEKARRLVIEASGFDFPALYVNLHGDSDPAALPVVERENGLFVPLRDIATIRDSFLDGDFLFHLNGNPTVGMAILIGPNESLLKVSRVTRSTVADFSRQLPPQIQAEIWGDSAGYIADRLEFLRLNGVQGPFLVALIFSLIESEPILPAHLAHVPLTRHRRHRPSAPAVRNLGAGAIPYPGVRLAGIRRAVRHGVHADPGAGADRHRRGCHRIFPAHPARANCAKHLSALPISLDKPRPHSHDMASFGSGGISPD